MKVNAKLTKRLKKMLESDRLTKLRITTFLGYKSTSTIDKWMANGEIPTRTEDRVKQFFRIDKGARR